MIFSVKRFIVTIKNGWKEAFGGYEYDAKDSTKLAKSMANILMSVSIEHRLIALKHIEECVLADTNARIVALEEEKELIIRKLEEYEKL